MSIRITPPSQAREKWQRRVSGAQQDYQTGVASAGNRYQEGVSGAVDSYIAGVQQAIAEHRWESGVSGKGSRYAQKAAQVGAARWTSGVAAAGADYEAGMNRVNSALSGVTLMKKGPKGSPGNLANVQVVVEALRAARGR
jgi:hypothetical protein